MEELLGLLGLGGGGLLTKQAYDRLGSIGDKAYRQSKDIGQEAFNNAAFTGYGVTGPLGRATVDSSGSLNLGLNDQQRAMMDMFGSRAMDTGYQNTQNQLNSLLTGDRFRRTDPSAGYYGALNNTANQGFGLASSFMKDLGMSTADREGSIYDRIRAMQQPGEDRQRSALEQRLAAQGRLGVKTNMYGGTPEQFALEKAQAEARNQAALQAMTQARAEQAQNAQIAQGMAGIGQTGTGLSNSLASQHLRDILGVATSSSGLANQAAQRAATYGQLQYAPQAALLDALGAGNQGYAFRDAANRFGTGLLAEARMSGLDALLGSRYGQANMMGQLGGQALAGGANILTSLFNQTGYGGSDFASGIGDTLGGLWDKAKSWWGDD